MAVKSAGLCDGKSSCRVGNCVLLITLSMGLLLLIHNVDKSPMLILIRANSNFFQQQLETDAPNWISVELEKNFTTKLYEDLLEPGGSPCTETETHDIRIGKLGSLITGYPHEISFEALDQNGTSHCLGGDFFEMDLSGQKWKSRPPLTDHGNGTYTFTLQVHHDFSGEYNLTIILLSRRYQNLTFPPLETILDKKLIIAPILFTRPVSVPELPPLPTCTSSDFNRSLWSGRWTRQTRNHTCEISDDGRYRCLEPDYPCSEPWCSGPLGSLESNGWVYSAHCGFKLFSRSEAWQCLNKRWLFWWGDSNHVDTVRNLLFFILGIGDVRIVSRRLDRTFTNYYNRSEKVRITNVFNGHWEENNNHEGLNTLSSSTHRELLESYFNGSGSPDTVIFNSGLHDARKWTNMSSYVEAAEYAVDFWEGLVKGMELRFVYRSTVAAGGDARLKAFTPSKIEAFNGVLLEKLLAKKGLVDAVVDDFDITWPWHFDNRCSDGIHYGKVPEKKMWRDGQIGHQYFVDLMLAHIHLNAICTSS